MNQVFWKCKLNLYFKNQETGFVFQVSVSGNRNPKAVFVSSSVSVNENLIHHGPSKAYHINRLAPIYHASALWSLISNVSCRHELPLDSRFLCWAGLVSMKMGPEVWKRVFRCLGNAQKRQQCWKRSQEATRQR